VGFFFVVATSATRKHFQVIARQKHEQREHVTAKFQNELSINTLRFINNILHLKHKFDLLYD